MKDLRSVTVVLCLWKIKKVYKCATIKTFLSVASNLLIHMCGYSLQISLSEAFSCFAPNISSYRRGTGQKRQI